ncbi:MAG TPA: ABC transporter ATP-binding protein [Thermoanaerobaculia bacterium]
MSHAEQAAIRADAVSVRYGKKVAVDSASLTVGSGSVYALLGRNGAGKSSLIRCITGLQKPDNGSITLLGDDAWRDRARLMNHVGIVPEDSDAPPAMRVDELAAFCGRLHARWNAAAVNERLSRFGVDGRARFGNLSKGQKKQVMLALALATSPEILILDDPSLGLDAVARKSLFDEVIAELADRGITIVVTTHDLSAIETIADRAAIMRDGRIVLDEEMETLKSRFRRIRFASAPVALSGGNLTAAMVRQWGSGTEAVVTNYDEVAFERFRSTAGVSHAEVAPMSLEEIFIAVTGEEERS